MYFDVHARLSGPSEFVPVDIRLNLRKLQSVDHETTCIRTHVTQHLWSSRPR